MRIFDAIENDVQSAAGDGFFERRESFGRSEARPRPDAGRAHRGAIQHFTRLKSHRNTAFARQFDDLLHTRSGGSFGDQDTIERTTGP